MTRLFLVRVGLIIGGALAAVLVPAWPAFAPCHVIGFEGAPYTVREGTSAVTITVTNNGGQQNADMMVDYETVNGTAVAGQDYVAENGTVTFPSNGSGKQSFPVEIINDSSDEPSQQFTVRLSNVRPPSSCVPPPNISEATAAVTITDNDPAPQPTQSTTPKPKPSTPKATASTTPTRSASPAATPTRTASPSPTASATTSSPTASPVATGSPVAAADENAGGGLGGGAVAGIVVAVVAVGGGAAFWIRRRLLA